MQFRSPRDVPWIYWLAVAMVAVAGTMAADVLHKQFGVPYGVSTPFFAIVLAAVFVVRASHRKDLVHTQHHYATARAVPSGRGDVHLRSWHRRRRSLLATTFKLGFFSAALVFVGLILIPVVGYWRFHMNGVLAFWFAYVVTRPIGVLFADWTGKSRSLTGLGWGDGYVALVLTFLIVVMVGYFDRVGSGHPGRRLRQPVNVSSSTAGSIRDGRTGW